MTCPPWREEVKRSVQAALFDPPSEIASYTSSIGTDVIARPTAGSAESRGCFPRDPHGFYRDVFGNTMRQRLTGSEWATPGASMLFW